MTLSKSLLWLGNKLREQNKMFEISPNGNIIIKDCDALVIWGNKYAQLEKPMSAKERRIFNRRIIKLF